MKNKGVKVNSNRKTKIALCYVGLVILIILLLLPPGLRLFITDKPPIMEEIITIMTCQKENEGISATFLNSTPRNVKYIVKGNLLETNEPDVYDFEIASNEENLADENSSSAAAAVGSTDLTNQTTDVADNPLLKIMKNFTSPTYDEEKNETSYSIILENIKDTSEYEVIFNTIEKQEAYYKSLGFSCIRKTQ